MKYTLPALALALLIGTAAYGDEKKTTTTTTVTPTEKTTTTTTTHGTGTITEYTPGSTFIVKETSGPVNYRYGKSVTYVTKSGTTLTEEQVKTRVKVGIPVTVHYASEGDARIVNRVVIED